MITSNPSTERNVLSGILTQIHRLVMMNPGQDPTQDISFGVGMSVIMVVGHGSINNLIIVSAPARREGVVLGCYINYEVCFDGSLLESDQWLGRFVICTDP